ncbi:MAG: hypothetical protein MUE45_07435 [Methanoregulaceae archaeon]|nr:hypothetical protein [Methanoregulaceae archaeon]
MFITPDFIHTPEEWIIWLLGSEFHDTATIDMLVQRTRYSREDNSIALVPNGKKMYGELILRAGHT